MRSSYPHQLGALSRPPSAPVQPPASTLPRQPARPRPHASPRPREPINRINRNIGLIKRIQASLAKRIAPVAANYISLSGAYGFMRTLSYRVTLRKEPEGGYTVLVPALPGCVTYGKTVEEAIEMSRDAITGYVESLIEDGEPVPMRP